MNRSPRKKALKAKRQAGRRDPEVKSGFRRLVIDGLVYQWRHHGDKVEIRTPQGPKHVVPVWELQGMTEAAWLKEHEECWEDCRCRLATPGMIRDFIFSQAAKKAAAKGA